MLRKTTVTFVNISDVYDHLGLTDDEITFIVNNAWRGVTYGDAHYTLIENVFALHYMVQAYEDYHLEVIANKSMTRDDFRRKFWEVVDSDDYINLEG